MSDRRNKKITELADSDRARLQGQRAIIEKYLADDDSRQKYQTAAGKLGLIRAILQGRIFNSSQTYELQCLGIIFGDVFIQELKMEWIMIEDEHGRDPAIRLAGTSINLFPLTMISKRIERGEEVDVFELFNSAAAQIKDIKRRGD